jgi:predicted ATPase
VLFELGARPHPPRELYRAYLEQSDIFIGLYWQRYGQVNPGMEYSALEEEFLLSSGMPRLLYLKGPAPDRESRLADLIFRIGEEASYRRFSTARELGRLVRDDLATLLSERFAESRRPAPSLRGLLPTASTALIGREEAIEDVISLVGSGGTRLVTLTGPGGVGKTRLALAVAARVRDRFESGTAFASLEPVTEPAQVVTRIGRAVGAELAGTDSPLDALAEYLGGGQWLLVLDNLEHVIDAAPDLHELLARCPRLTILATSRTVLRLADEHEYPVAPLPVPPADAAALEELAGSPAVMLFVERASAVRYDFALTPSNAASVVDICRRLEGLPLAIELAAARIRTLDPAALASRLVTSLDALGTGAVDLPERQQTLRATVDWSVGLLDDAERSLLEIAAVFADGWTVDAAAEVAGMDEDQALDLTEALVGHSLIRADASDHGPRLRMLDTIREFTAERLSARPDFDAIERRHAEHYRELAERSDRPLRTFGQSDWVERLRDEAANVAVAMRWYLAHDPTMLPHLFRVLSPFRVLWVFWGVRHEILAGARSWVDQLLPDADALDPAARAELLLTATIAALETSDDAAAVAARDRLAPLLEEIDDPYLVAVSELVNSWTSFVVNDISRAVDEAERSLEKLRGQDEPLWTAMALLSLGSLEAFLGREQDGVRHLIETRDMAERFDNEWLAGASRVRLGIVAMLRGSLDEAAALLDEALEVSLATDNTYNLILCLVACGLLALARGDAERAALLTGAAAAMRRRAGLEVFSSLTGEAQGIAQIRAALPADRFDRAFAAGSALDSYAAVAAVRELTGAAALAS